MQPAEQTALDYDARCAPSRVGLSGYVDVTSYISFCPEDQLSVQLKDDRVKRCAVEPPIILEPTSYDRIAEPRLFLDRLVTTSG